MEIRIIFEAENASFVDYPRGDGNFDEEIKAIMKQATEFILCPGESDLLKDSNGNTVGRVWMSTVRRP